MMRHRVDSNEGRMGVVRSIRFLFLNAAALLFVFVYVSSAFSFSVSVAWDASTGPSVAGYKLYCGTSSREYSMVFDAGKRTSCTLPGLQAGKTHYIAATAYDSGGNESAYSEELIVHTINSSAGTGGVIMPQGVIPVAEGGSRTFTVTPASGFRTAKIAVNGVAIGNPGTYTFSGVQGNQTIAAIFGKSVKTGSVTALTTKTAALSAAGPDTSQNASLTATGPTSSETGTSSLVADAGPDQQAQAGSHVSLSGANSTGSPQETLFYRWIQIGGTRVSLSKAKSMLSGFTAPLTACQGEALTFQLTVTGRNGRQAVDTCIVNVSGNRLPPNASAGPDQDTDARSTVTLDGSGSFDPDGGIAAYAWTQIAGPRVDIRNPSAATATFVAPEAITEGASLVFLLTVTDHDDLMATDTCIVNVSGTGVSAVGADAGPDYDTAGGRTARLDGSLSQVPSGAGVTFRWRQTSGPPVALSSPSAVRPTFQVPTGAEELDSVLTFMLTLTDENGFQSSDDCKVRIIAAKSSGG